MGIPILLSAKTEWLKYKHTSLFWLTLVAASLMPFIQIISCLESDELYAIMMHRYPWHFFLMINWQVTSMLILPVYILLLNNSIAQTEYRNNGWKQVYALPRSYADIFFSKFIVAQVMIALFFACFNLLYLLAGTLLFLFKGVHGFLQFEIPWGQMLIISMRVYVGTLAFSAIQYWLSLRFKNFMIPIGTGFGLLIACLLIGRYFEHFYSPYLFPFFMFLAGHSKEQFSLNSLYIISIASFILALLLGYRNICSLKEKG